MSPPTGLTAILVEIVSSLINERNFQLPVYIVTLASNGSLMYGRFVASADGVEAEILAEHIEGPGLQCPIHLIFLDTANKELARVDLENEQPEKFTIQ